MLFIADILDGNLLDQRYMQIQVRRRAACQNQGTHGAATFLQYQLIRSPFFTGSISAKKKKVSLKRSTEMAKNNCTESILQIVVVNFLQF